MKYETLICREGKKVKLHANKYYILQAIKERNFITEDDLKQLKKYNKSVKVEPTKKGYKLTLIGLIGGDVIVGYYKKEVKKKGRPKSDLPLDTTKAFRLTSEEKEDLNNWLHDNPDIDIRHIVLDIWGIN